MRDLVETVISQVMRQDPKSALTPRRMPEPGHRVHHPAPAGRAISNAPKQNDPLWQASRQFESLFVEQMLSSMRKTIPDSGLLNKGFAQGVSTTMMDQAVADAIGKQGRMGIATSLYRQLSQDATRSMAQGSSASVQAKAEVRDIQETGLRAAGGRMQGE